MNSRILFLALVPIGPAMLIGGCATTGPAGPAQVSAQPSTFLAGAELEHAKSIAMGSAVSKGWKIVASSDDRLVLGRSIDRPTAQSVLGADLSSAAVEVTARFFERPNGIAVVAAAALVADNGAEQERRIDFTKQYANELYGALDSLRRSWDENRERIASATPPIPTEVSTTVDTQQQDATATPEDPADDRIPNAVNPAPVDPTTPAERAAEYAAAWPSAVSSPAAPAAPVEDRSAGAEPSPGTAGDAAAITQPNEMIVLNRIAEPGIWSYYAEHYAKIRGCEVADSGSILEEKRPEYEIHRVSCDNGEAFRVRCNAGTCRGIP